MHATWKQFFLLFNSLVSFLDLTWLLRYFFEKKVSNDIYGFRLKTHGTMAKYMKYIPGSRIHKVSKDIPPEIGVFVEPLHAVNRADIKLTDVVVVSYVQTIGTFSFYWNGKLSVLVYNVIVF